MRRLAAPLLLIITLGCNGSAGTGNVSKRDAAAEEIEPDAEAPPPEPEVDAAAPPAEDATPPALDVPPVTIDAPPVVAPMGAGPDATVMAFQGTPVYWGGGMDNKRQVDVQVKFPDAGLLYKSVTLKLNLRCPATGGCDFWDRRAYLGVVHKNGDKESVTEILRFMTPYRVTASWTADVTALRPLLSGAVTLRVFIDTWVGPTSTQGAGWLVDATFEMVGGMPDRVPLAFIPLWDETKYDYGDPLKPVATAVVPRSLTLPPGAGAVELRSFITGHGQGNLDNCAEFCPRTHAFTLDGKRFERMVWRNDCATTAIPNQGGNWKPSRAGWCPGAAVLPWVTDVSAMAQAGKPITIGYDVQPYVNSCRPDSPKCTGCAFNTPCAYNDGSHTSPFFVMSAALIVYAK
jgi:hypothetical protein